MHTSEGVCVVRESFDSFTPLAEVVKELRSVAAHVSRYPTADGDADGLFAADWRNKSVAIRHTVMLQLQRP